MGAHFEARMLQDGGVARGAEPDGDWKERREKREEVFF
jgi:hypothetical protein